MKIEKYLLELLKKQECVIIPSFGAFITQPTAATHVPSDNKFFPPAKLVSFNKLLTNNDGLLIQYIATQNQVTYIEAQQWVTTQVNTWNLALENNETIIIKNIGKIYKQYDNKINFIPDLSQNLAIQSYGLQATKHIPIDRSIEKSIKLNATVNKSVEIKKSTNKKLELNRKNKNRKRNYAVAIAACFIIGLAFTQLFFFADAPVKLNEANFITFVNSTETITPKLISSSRFNHSSLVPTHADKLNQLPRAINLENVQNSKSITADLVNLKTTSVNEVNAPSSTAGYYLILGCFKETKNANKLFNQLIAQGKQAIKRNNSNGTTTIAEFASNNESIAKKMLQDKQQSQADVWMKWYK